MATFSVHARPCAICTTPPRAVAPPASLIARTRGAGDPLYVDGEARLVLQPASAVDLLLHGSRAQLGKQLRDRGTCRALRRRSRRRWGRGVVSAAQVPETVNAVEPQTPAA